ncbi:MULTISPECIES: DUF2971 domain-containing protein [Xanthomonas]|uniref:DUF2971 domain-containing protein n=1 Tax=Xanthomonas TaxID=338 RepID=UPI000E1FAF46|nr:MULTISPECIES: DUF2971 domain-containing protein [Xanthomonas]
MGGKIYKYFSPQVADLVFNDAGVTLKFSLPKDFNDPYELFLTVDYLSDPDALACYEEAIGSIPQDPTTCFSVSPSISPMWAHYGQNAAGFVIEFDEEELKECFPESNFGNVTYQNEPSEGLTEMLYRVCHIGKPRYTYMLRNGAYSAAYFTKAACWSYEMERRMVVQIEHIRESNGILLMDVPKQCITSIITGARADLEFVESVRARATQFNCSFFEMKIGRSTIKPYFFDSCRETCIFDGTEISQASVTCNSCGEPVRDGNEKCSWCQIDDGHRREAAIKNPYRMLHRFGRLEAYIQAMDKITNGIRKGDD